MSLAYLGAVDPTPTQAAQAVATMEGYAGRLSTLVGPYGTYRIPPAGFTPVGSATMAVDDVAKTVLLASSAMKVYLAAWADMRAFAGSRGVNLPAWLPTNYDPIARALPTIRAALSSVHALVRAAVDDNSKAEGDRIAVTRGEVFYTGPTMVVTSKPPALPRMAMSTSVKVAVGVGVAGLLWVLFGKKRRK